MIAQQPKAVHAQKPDELVRNLLRSGLSQETIAGALNVTQPTVSRILSGKHKDPRYSVVEKLRALLLTTGEWAKTP